MDNWFDVCEFKRKWDSKKDFNMFVENWPTNYLVFANPPYSQTASCIFKAIIEFLKGVNVVLLIPYLSVASGKKLKNRLP